MGRRGGAGEGDHVGALLSEASNPSRDILRFRNCLVDRDIINDGTQLLEFNGKHFPGSGSSGKQHLEMLDVELLEGFEKRLGDEFLGDQVDGIMILAHFFSRSVADDGDTGSPQVSGILMGGEEGVKKCLHTVRAGEDDPIVGADVGKGLHEGCLVGGRFDPDRRKFVGIGTEFAKRCE